LVFHSPLQRSVGLTFSLITTSGSLPVIETERAWQSLGKISYGATAAEQKSLVFRRSLYVTEDLQVGDRFTPDNVRAIRPGHGLPPKYAERVLGKTARKAIKRGTPISWDLFM